MATLELATTILHDDINNFEKQGEVNLLRRIMEDTKVRKAKGATIRSRVR